MNKSHPVIKETTVYAVMNEIGHILPYTMRGGVQQVIELCDEKGAGWKKLQEIGCVIVLCEVKATDVMDEYKDGFPVKHVPIDEYFAEDK